MGITLVGGVEAVEIFFMISGFYMALILNEKYTGSGSFYVFITNRILRIFPVYWVVLLVTLFICILGYFVQGKGGRLESFLHYAPEINGYLLAMSVLSNFLIIGQDWLLLLDIDGSQWQFARRLDLTEPAIATDFLIVPQAWTLGIELTFYLMAPFLVRFRSWLIMALLVGTLALRIYFKNAGMWEDPWSYRFFPFELGFFLLGCLGYKAYHHLKNANLGYFPMLAFFVVILFVVCYQFIPGFEVKRLFLYMVIAILLPFVFVFTKNNKFDRGLGELSYPVYLVHVFVITVFSAIGVHAAIWIVIGSVLGAFVLNFYIANPVERVRSGRVEFGIKK